jgi:hypothetical protein
MNGVNMPMVVMALVWLAAVERNAADAPHQG